MKWTLPRGNNIFARKEHQKKAALRNAQKVASARLNKLQTSTTTIWDLIPVVIVFGIFIYLLGSLVQ